MDAPFHADARDQVLEAEARADDPDRAHDRTRIGDDLVGGAGQPVAARSGHVFDEGDDRQALLGGMHPDALGDQRGLYGGAAGRVEGERDGLGPTRLEGPLEQRRDRFDRQAAAAQQAAGSDDAREADDGHDRPATKTIPDPIQHAGHCRGHASRRQAPGRGAGWPRPRRCSRRRVDAGPGAGRRAGASHPHGARGRERARPAAVASR